MGAAQAVERAELTQSLLERKNSVRLKQIEPRPSGLAITIKLMRCSLRYRGGGA